MSEKVTLLVYDITMGMAKGMSMMLIGQQIDAVYHTSIVAFGSLWTGEHVVLPDPREAPAKLKSPTPAETRTARR